MKVNDNTIGENTIRKIQMSQYYMLKSFDKFCKKHDLNYTLDFGTILGAIRHKGFIPWDDDIDVAMLRSEYDRFLSLSKDWENENIFVQNYHTDPQFIHSFTRLRLNDSLAIQDEWRNLKAHQGIFIDIFTYDVVAGDGEASQLHADEIRTVQEEKMKYVEGNTVDYSNLLVLNKLQTSIMTRFNHNITDDTVVAHMTQGLNSYYETRRKVSDFTNLKFVQFELASYPIPKSYDTILKNNYGEYMAYPNKDEQQPHHGVIRLRFRDDILKYFRDEEKE